MHITVVIFGFLIAGIGLWGFVFPNSFMIQLLRLVHTGKGLYWIVGWCLLFGFVLVINAPFSLYSTFFYVIGTLSLFGALVSIMMGHRYVELSLDWWQAEAEVYLRCVMLMGWLLGVTLTYMAFVSFVC